MISILWRFLCWFLVWAFTLFATDINVEYTDGLKINFTGWVTGIGKLFNRED